MKRSKVVKVGATGAISVMLVSGLSGCASEADYAEVCMDPTTQMRVDDASCEDETYRSSNGLVWFYIGRATTGGNIPPVGSTLSATGGSTMKPATGSVARGGFGKGFGGFGG